MSKDRDRKPTVEEIISMIDVLTPGQQEKLRQEINSRFWRQNLKQWLGPDFPRNTNQTWQKLIERLESGNIDEDIKGASGRFWQDMLNNLGLSESGPNSSTISDPESQNLELQFEMASLILQDKLAEARQALGQAMALEEQLEQHLSFCKAQAIFWIDKSAAASQEGNEPMAEYARRRHSECVSSAAAVSDQLKEQKTVRARLQKKLVELEGLA